MEMRVNTGKEKCVIACNILAQKRSKRLKRDVREELPATATERRIKVL